MGAQTGMSRTLQLSALTSAIFLSQAAFADTEDTTKKQEKALEHIVVTASGNQTTLANAPASISLIDASEIHRQPVKDLVDVLETLPGVTNQPTSGGRNGIMIRGLNEDYVLRLINGKRISSSNGIWRANNFDNSPLPLQYIERVEVVRGPMSALYGSDAVAGVVNIITKKPQATWQNYLSLETSIMQQGEGGDRDRMALVSSGLLTDTLGLTFSAEKAKQDAWYYEPIAESAEHTLIEPRDALKLATTLDWQPADNQSLSLDLAYDEDEVPLSSYGYAQYQQDIERWTYGLTWRGEWSWGGSELLVNRSDAKMLDYNSRYVDLATTDRDERFLQPDEIFTTVRGSVFASYGIHTLTAGAEYLETEVKDDIQYPVSGGASLNLKSLFVQDQIDLTERLTATIGLRAEDAEIYGSHLSPRGYLVYNLSDDITIKGGVGSAFRAPTLFQASPLFQSISCGGNCFIYGNPDLNEETSVNTELAVLIERDNWHASLTWFHNKVDDLMEVGYFPDDHANAGNRGYFNIEEATLQGIEATFWWRLHDRVSLNTNYSYLDARDGNDVRLERRPRHKAYARVDVDVTEALSLYVAHNYYGEQADAYVADQVQDAYGITDIGGRYVFSTMLAFKAGVTNLGSTQPREKDPASILYLQGKAFFAGVDFSF
ncbi:MAG: outer membrane receptor for ferrienterochelin and colicins [Rheinheimera aquimaris]|jgi:outer membrane receptor for ferrienterochelin and colicins|uniref:TonB-dependent receptor domain-containing protein n=1 Tax=Rheinheimera aquimaris TaxID=412437 RepID=UPI0039E590A2